MLNELIWPVVTLGILAVFFGIVLTYASKKFAVVTDPKVEQIRDILPGANCGACGYAGCDALADAIAKGESAVSACPVCTQDAIEKIADVLGVAADNSERMVARVICNGNSENAKEKYEYQGIEDCKAAQMIAGGPKACPYGCTGLGTCERVCPFDAIHVIDGVAIVDEEKCTACKKCIEACPKDIIELVPASKHVRVLCNSVDKGKAVMSVCKVGCIGCQRCVKACEFDAMTFQDNLAKIDYSKCTNCMVCAEVCPTKTIYADFSKRKKAYINEELCIGCTLCKKACKFDAIEGELKGKHKITEDKCLGCGQCEIKCPQDAIIMK